MSTETAVKQVTAKARKSTDGTMWVFVVYCPMCGEPHVHGAGVVSSAPDRPDPGYFGMRQAHCLAGEYEIVEEKIKPVKGNA